MEAARRMERIGSHISASAGGALAGSRDNPDDIVIVDAIRTPITRARKVRVRQMVMRLPLHIRVGALKRVPSSLLHHVARPALAFQCLLPP